MEKYKTNSAPLASPAQNFLTTHWSVVLAAGKDDTQGSKKAMETLCQIYWYPLYTFARKNGIKAHDAQDLTQGFFEQFIKKDYAQDAHPSKGRFRSFMLASFKHYISNQHDKAHAIKRGANHTFISMDAKLAEDRYRLEPAKECSADHLYDRQWAMTVLDRVLDQLIEDYEKRGQRKLFEQLKNLLTGAPMAPYGLIASTLSLQEGAVKVAAHRLRKRYREFLRAEICHTVLDPKSIDQEIRYLFLALGD